MIEFGTVVEQLQEAAPARRARGGHAVLIDFR
jgi:hypothetical protein